MKLLRDVKTEALLVFIKITLKEAFSKSEDSFAFKLSNKSEDKKLHSSLLALYKDLNSLRINSFSRYLPKKDVVKSEPILYYYEYLARSMASNLVDKQIWIPELVVICLLSEWLVEEEKSVNNYPFLKNVNYIELICMYDKVKKTSAKEEKEIIMNMYKLSSKIIENYKKCKYKVVRASTKRRR